jgi:gamma-glutamyl hercynylcysteine S-oxide synthase
MHGMPMSDASIQINIKSNMDWRRANVAQIAHGLQDLRTKTLAVFDAYVTAGRLTLPYADELNPPLWELGHLAWFQEFWIGRNQQRHLGIHYDVNRARLPSVLAQADSWYNSSLVSHEVRWHLPLLEPQACKDYLATTLNQTLALLTQASSSDDALYFYRLVMFHEAMHLEAAIYMAQAVGVDFDANLKAIFTPDLIAIQTTNTPATSQFKYTKQAFYLGSKKSRFDSSFDVGFAFDNELGSHPVEVAAFEIDSRCVHWGGYLKFVEATSHKLPRYVRRSLQGGESGYENQVFGIWKPLDLQATTVHISLAEAQNYCAWVGRRLPTEAEWELAASSSNAEDFKWGNVWEWTSSTFAPYPGFAAHPYLDYSEPWFGSRQVLRGACAATQPMMKNIRYRNYFTHERTDIYSGFRTCRV